MKDKDYNMEPSGSRLRRGPAPDWAQVKLRVAFGDVPDPGTVLLLTTGRRYQVLKVAGKTLHVIVLPRDHDPGAEWPVWTWAWTKRGRRPRRA